MMGALDMMRKILTESSLQVIVCIQGKELEICGYELTIIKYFVDAKQYLAIENWKIIPCIEVLLIPM